MSGHLVHLVYLMCTISIMCSTTWNPVISRRTQKLLALLASQLLSTGVQAMQVCHHVCRLPGTLCTPRASSSTALHAAGFTLTFGQGCNATGALMHVTTPRLRPIYPYCTPSKVVLSMMRVCPW